MVWEGLVDFQRLYVEVNGRAIAKLIYRIPSQHELFIPAETLVGSNTVEIVFHTPDALSPSALGGSGDTRPLGVWLSSLQLQLLVHAPKSSQAAAAASDKEILMDLQSLGENCELGFVQRSGGAEPFGLFRWASTPLANLLNALEARFEGLGQPENIAIEVDEASEFQILDKKFGFRNHSFAFRSAGARKEDILKRELVRLPFMAQLLIEDLEQATKLFCFHDAGRSGLDRIELLIAAIGKYGPNSLLWVCPAKDLKQVGTAERVHDRLIRGYIDRFQPLDHVRQPSLEAWVATIRAAHDLWRRGQKI